MREGYYGDGPRLENFAGHELKGSLELDFRPEDRGIFTRHDLHS